MLGVPTIGDRIAQTVVAARIEAAVEPEFHQDSMGTGHGAVRWTLWGNAGKGAGDMTG